jgi:hypothetical protein
MTQMQLCLHWADLYKQTIRACNIPVALCGRYSYVLQNNKSRILGWSVNNTA